MFDGNVIYEMNPVGEINIPHEEKAPNMNDDGKGKISIATGGSSGGGIRVFNIEIIGETPTRYEYIIHGAKINDLKTVFYLDGVIEDGEDPITILVAYSKMWGGDESLSPLTPDFYGGPYSIDGEYLDGVKIYAMKAD